MYDEFAGFLTTRLRERKESVRRLAQATGIPEETIQHLLAGDTSALPAAPYMHGYLVKLGEELHFDGEDWWRQLKRSVPITSSGLGDRMPRNRFSRNKIPAWALWGVPLLLILLAFFGFRFAAIIGLPDVAIAQPDRDGIVVNTSSTTLTGSATPGSRLTINGEAIPLSSSGSWEKEVTLQPGAPNDFTVQATKFLGRSRSASRRIFFEPPVMTTSTSPTTSTVPVIATSSSTTVPSDGTRPTTTIVTF